jgi:hypothetical protein
MLSVVARGGSFDI